MPWDEYEKEREEEEREKEKEKKKAWERYLGQLCDRKRKEKESGEEEGRKEGTGLVIPMRKEVLQTRFRALFKEGSLENMKEEEQDEKEVLRCKKAAEITKRNEFRMRYVPALRKDELHVRRQRARDLEGKLMALLFPTPQEEVTFPGQVVSQVLKGKVCSEPNSIKIMHRTPAGLGFFWVGLEVSLNRRFEDTYGWVGVGAGYWATKGRGACCMGMRRWENWGLMNTQKLCFILG